ncbi:endonuclease [Roseovarius salis]|uniref:endonuclease n=1 Tax=Roseovarius salis TaxID=3376063 RepID=UPI0037CB8C53
MANNTSGLSCGAGCWLMAAAAGVLAVILMLTIGNLGIMASLFLGGVIVVGLGLLFTFLFCRELPATGPRGATTGTKASAPKDAERAEQAQAEGAHAATARTGAVASGNQLPGEQELAARKGAWKYEGERAATGAAPAPQGGVRPEGLDRARGGQPDDLKQIKGIGPKLEQLLNSMGYYHFDQIAAWAADEVAWVDENLEGFRGRVSRDDWVEQAKTLAAGGETEFSRRVGDGEVY